MPRQPTTANNANIGEGLVACSPNEWARMVQQALSISDTDPQKNDKLCDFGIKEHSFSSGSDLTKTDYLRLRVLWNTRPAQDSFRKYIRNNPTLLNEKNQRTPYTGYISPENDEIADAIYNTIKPRLDGYLQDIQRVGKGNSIRPSGECGLFYWTRYLQGMVLKKLKEVYDENDKKKVFRGKIRKSEVGLPQAIVLSQLPRTPSRPGSSREPQEGFGTPGVDPAGASAGGLQNPPTSDESHVNTALLCMLNAVTRLMRECADEDVPAPLAAKLSKVHGLGYLDWLGDHLPFHLTDRSSRTAQPKELMVARIDGYLCRCDFVEDSRYGQEFESRLNHYPLAIVEAKPFTRLSALSAIRWQESAEIAAWVSGLDDDYENVGLLQSSTSGRKRRLLISQDRHELWIIIAEYGDGWKQYIRGTKMPKPADLSQSQDVEDLAGSEGFVSLVKSVAPGEFGNMMKRAEQAVKRPGSTRASRGPSLELPGPEYFCIMQQWGPYKIADWKHMDFFIRRLIGLQVELLQNWPRDCFEHPDPQ